MAKLTLLDMTQSILSAMDSDSVNDIDDTVESIQVADLIKEAFYELMSERDWSFLQQLTTLNSLADPNNPTKMGILENLNKVLWIKYNKKEVRYLSPDDFDDLLSKREILAGVVNSDGIILNRDPQYYTSYDEKYIIFDSYEATIDSILQSSKCKVFGVVSPQWQHENNCIPDIPEKFFTTLLAEAKSQAFVNLKQQVNAREERKAQKGRIRLQSESYKINDGEFKYNRKVNYGRR
ncbi:MAG: hypothetical protein IM557_08225 [Chitinophagaceae bacterium]|nr:hypothetical protein [Chitinophagaceae bacterium]